MLPSLSLRRKDRRADYRFYCPFTARFITADEVVVVLRGMDKRISSSRPKGWDFSEVANEFVGCNANLNLHELGRLG